ncbi:MAG: PQQ-binding-like beta-propeller repeat protein [Pirellulales bacterium]|nr:PQQ-binding-like beta-propeller repeat protein [Pirellulales bacterium]
MDQKHHLRLFCQIFATVWIALLWAASAAQANDLISSQEANRHGLVRAWFAVAEIDASRGQLERVSVDGDSVLVLTSRGTMQVLDAATGATRWSRQIGNPDYPSLGPAANAKYVALVNGSTLYVLERETGELHWERQLRSGPGAGPGLTDTMVYVPIINGAIEGFALEDTKQPLWIYQSNGRALVQPVTTSSSVFWSTDRGFFYVGRADDPGVRYRIEMEDEITERPAVLEPMVYSVSRDGSIYATEEITGIQRWRYAIGDPITEAPAAVRDRVFICSNRPKMVCFDADHGTVLWEAARVNRFVAVSEDRVYAADSFHRLHILDLKSGARLGELDTHGASLPIDNQQTDRIYLATPTGLIQCLHERDRTQPLIHSKLASGDQGEAKKTGKETKDQSPEPTEEDLDETNPFGEEAEEKEEEENPFGSFSQ